MPLFTIITVVRNNLDGLKRTAQSVQGQSFRDFEWHVVDGASTDGSQNFLAAITVSEPDGGIYDAMNKGIGRAQGDYLIFMNAGDSFADFFTLERIAATAAKMRPDLLYGDAIEDGRIKPARSHTRIASGLITHHQAIVYKRKPRLYDMQYRIAADYKYTAQAIFEAETCVHMPFPVCIFEQGGISQREAAQGRWEQADIRDELGLRAPFAPMLQWLALGLKRAVPSLYWALRRLRGA